MGEWLPIESAPRDWTEVLLFSPEHCDFNTEGVFAGWFDADRKGWFTHMAGGPMRLNPTHWMPLPAPPEPQP